MTESVFLIVVTILCVCSTVFHTGVYYNKIMTTEDRSLFDLLPVLPYGIAGFWGLIIIIKTGVIL